jgi:hypothetical protein
MQQDSRPQATFEKIGPNQPTFQNCLSHTVNSGSEMVEAKHVSEKNTFWSSLTAKSRAGKIFEFLHCPFERRAKMHHKIQPNWQTGRCCLAGGSKGQCRKSKFFLSLLLPMKVDQHIFFPETFFASTISQPEFTVLSYSGQLVFILFAFLSSELLYGCQSKILVSD